MALPSGDFEAFAKAALGTDDPERIAALKEAIKACEAADDAGEYGPEEEAPEGEGLALLFGGGGKKK